MDESMPAESESEVATVASKFHAAGNSRYEREPSRRFLIAS